MLDVKTSDDEGGFVLFFGTELLWDILDKNFITLFRELIKFLRAFESILVFLIEKDHVLIMALQFHELAVQVSADLDGVK